MLKGKKTIIGATFLAVTMFMNGIEPMLGADTVMVVKAITGSLGTFFAAFGIGDKIQKVVDKS